MVEISQPSPVRFSVIQTSIEGLVSHSPLMMISVWKQESIWVMERILSSSPGCDTHRTFIAYPSATQTSGSGGDSFYIPYYRMFMELVPDSVGLHLEGTVSACI